MTKQEAAIVSAYTGILIGSFSDMHEYVESLFHGPVYTHQFGDKGFAGKVKEMSKDDFLSMEISDGAKK
ncbi:MAG: hypothetical protein PF483_03400 [Halothiobacillus sp.]|jgi:hypothetical protein|nr:hypothetical protein [Halothiobacillus sp.]